jgi:Zn-dependent M16 (insulinase) family peptidase
MFYAETLFEKYVAGIEMLKDAIFNVKFTADRTKSICSQLLNIIPPAKLKASSIVDVLSDSMYFNKESVIHHTSFLRQKKFLETVMAQLEKDPAPVLQKLQDIAKWMVQPKRTQVYMTTDVEKLTAGYGSKAAEMWRDLFPRNDQAFEFKKAEELKEKSLLLADHKLTEKNPEHRHAITGKKLAS